MEASYEKETKIYLKILAALLVLTVITVITAKYMYFGNLNMVVAMVIASLKATLVLLFFMHLKHENPLTWLYAFFPIFLLVILFAGIFIDNPLRKDPTQMTLPSSKLAIEEAVEVNGH